MSNFDEKLQNDPINLGQFIVVVNMIRYVCLHAITEMLPNESAKSRPKRHIERILAFFCETEDIDAFFTIDKRTVLIRFDAFAFLMICAPRSKILATDLRKKWVSHWFGNFLPCLFGITSASDYQWNVADVQNVMFPVRNSPVTPGKSTAASPRTPNRENLSFF